MEKHEIRQNKATKEWVIYAPSRGKRPRDFRQQQSERMNLPVLDKSCPFCPGNEAKLPGIIMQMPEDSAATWQTRVVPNKFPALTPDGNTGRQQEGIYVTMPGNGRHEVIIESPFHNQQIAQMTTEEVSRVVETYHRRYVELMKAHENMMTIIFRNHGARAGTSLIHPHSQVIVTSFVPHYIRWREEEAQRYFDEWGRCVFCDMLDYERRDGRRVVMDTETFLAFVPFAAEVPFEINVMPKNHRADFGNISDEEKADLAKMLREILSRIYHKLNDPDYNYIIHSSARYRAGEPQVHWYLQIRPRLTTRAGFEIGSGISINPSLPEADADFLRVPVE